MRSSTLSCCKTFTFHSSWEKYVYFHWVHLFHLFDDFCCPIWVGTVLFSHKNWKVDLTGSKCIFCTNVIFRALYNQPTYVEELLFQVFRWPINFFISKKNVQTLTQRLDLFLQRKKLVAFRRTRKKRPPKKPPTKGVLRGLSSRRPNPTRIHPHPKIIGILKGGENGDSPDLP